MNICGYAHLKMNLPTLISSLDVGEFTGEIVRILSFSNDDEKNIIIVNDKATGIATVNITDVERFFKCEVVGDIVCPPDLSITNQFIYINKALSRKGGYGQIIKQMVIISSLAKGKFNNHFLWVLQ